MRLIRLMPVWILSILILSPIANADDWPNWMGPQKNGVWAESNIIDSFDDSGAKIVWRQPISGGYGGPAIVGNQVFVMERIQDDGKGGSVENNIRAAGEIAGGERVKCLSLADGSLVWQQEYDCPYQIAYPNGPRCTPTVDQNRVYTLGAMGDLLCLDKSNGKIQWQTNLPSKYDTKPPVWGFSSHPIIDGEKLIVPVGGTGSGVVAFDKNSGKEIWKAVSTFDIAYAPLVIYESENTDERQLIFWHAEGVTSLNPETGDEFWFIKFPEQKNMSQTSIATPIIFGDHLLISEFYKGSLLIKLGSGPPSGTEVWRSHESDPRNRNSLNAMMATPIVKDGHAYGIGFNGRGQGVFRCVELESNTLKWAKEDWLSEKPIMFATAFAVENQGRYFLFTDVGDLMIAELSPEGFREIDRANVISATTPARGRKVVWCHPAFANSRMVVRNDEEIVCVDLRKPAANNPG